jgi:trimethylguanosine synthase
MGEPEEALSRRLELTSRDRFDQNPERFQMNYNTLPKQCKKYWRQRYDLFSRFDEGVYMNAELWYSVTPEIVAIFISKFIHACDPEVKTILDVFCGGGGNTIQMARYFDKAFGIDLNEEHLYCTEKNADIYGVQDKIELYKGSWPDGIDDDHMRTLQGEVDFVFASPPWGGPGYKGKDCFDLTLLQPISVKQLLESFFKISPNVCLFLPRNSDLSQLSEVTTELCGPDSKCRIIYVYCNGYIKGIYAIWGEKFMPAENDQGTLSFTYPCTFNDDYQEGSFQEHDYTNTYSHEYSETAYQHGEYDRGYQNGYKDGYTAGYQAALAAMNHEYQGGGSIEDHDGSMKRTNDDNDPDEREKIPQNKGESTTEEMTGINGGRYANEVGSNVDYGEELDY